MNIVIVESPTKANTIGKFLGPKFKVLSSYGHIRDLPENEFGVDIKDNFKPKYAILQKAAKNIQALKKESKKAEKIILATDEDREGEAIAWHLVHALNLNEAKRKNKSKSYCRIAFHEITKTAIETALKNPRDIDLNLVDAQQARRILDRIVGYKLSPFLWKKVARRLSAGRVQSVAARLVTEREKERENFVSQEYWTINAQLEKNLQGSHPCQFNALLAKKDGKIIQKLDIKNKKEVDEILKDLEGAEYKVINAEKKETKRNPLPPFTTSTLQQESWKRFRFPAKITMQLAQQLYERGLITYHRTDSLNLSDLSLVGAKKFIISNLGENYFPSFSRKYKTKSKTSQEAHEAIRPSYAEKSPEKLNNKLNENQFRLYEIIWQRFIASQMKEAIFDSTAVEIEAGKYIFRASGQILKFDGFLKIYPVKYEEAELPNLKINEILKLIKLISSQHFTQPPARYTEATLIKTLEENGIGRPSTYAPIISTIQLRNYIEKDENKSLRPTEIGTAVNDLLVKHFPEIVEIKFTAEMEEILDEIAQGKRKWIPVIKDFYEPFEKNLEKKYKEVSKEDLVKTAEGKICPNCGATLLIRLGKFGKFYACSKFPKCKYTESLKENNLGINCPKCQEGKVVEKRTKKNKIFYGCDKWPKCDFALWDKPIEKFCPKCQSILVETKRKQTKCSNKLCLPSNLLKAMVRGDFIKKGDKRNVGND